MRADVCRALWRTCAAWLVAWTGPQIAAAADAPHAGPSLGEQLPSAAVVPFIAMLLSIAVFPLVAPHWWERNRSKAIVSLVLSLPLAVYLVVAFGDGGLQQLVHKVAEYLSFIALLAA